MEKNLLPRLSNCPPDIESLRLYLTLPESPLFCDRNNYVTIVIPFAKSIIALKEAALKVLGKMSSLLTQICHLKWFLSLFIYLSCTRFAFAPGNWWSKFEPQVFQRLVELYKEVVVYLLQMYKVGIPSVEQRIFNSFLETALRLLEILHGVRQRVDPHRSGCQTVPIHNRGHVERHSPLAAGERASGTRDSIR